MMKSMTAFASRTGAVGAASWVWEVRGVNARGLDLRLRLPDGIEGLEAAVRKALTAQLSRGNVTLSLRVSYDDAAGALAVDEVVLDNVLAALDAIQERALDQGITLGQPTAADVLAHRGVLVAGQVADDPAFPAAILADIEPLVADFCGMRAQEGAALAQVLAGQVDQIDALVQDAVKAAAARQADMQTNLTASLARVLQDVAEVEPDRIAQELAVLAVKSDITEEIDRLGAHVQAARDLLKSDQPVGRKLDFLMQEFNREANTLCAKAQSKALTSIGLDLKAVIDQMREQVQNVE